MVSVGLFLANYLSSVMERRLQQAPSMCERVANRDKLARSRSRGFATNGTVLAAAVVMGCFVYPMSLSIRDAGAHLADEAEVSCDVILGQRR